MENEAAVILQDFGDLSLKRIRAGIKLLEPEPVPAALAEWKCPPEDDMVTGDASGDLLAVEPTATTLRSLRFSGKRGRLSAGLLQAIQILGSPKCK